MGLDVSHDCWSGAYSGFMRFRIKLCEVAGYGDIMKREGYAGFGITPAIAGETGLPIPWPDDDVLSKFLRHSDCEGWIPWKVCQELADRLKELLPGMQRAGEGWGHLQDYGVATQRWIEGLELAASLQEHVRFH